MPTSLEWVAIAGIGSVVLTLLILGKMWDRRDRLGMDRSNRILYPGPTCSPMKEKLWLVMWLMEKYQVTAVWMPADKIERAGWVIWPMDCNVLPADVRETVRSKLYNTRFDQWWKPLEIAANIVHAQVLASHSFECPPCRQVG
jgi:hypothetical protein